MAYNVNTSEISLGAAKIWVRATGETVWTALGATMGGLRVNISSEYHDTTIDQLGSTIVKKFLMGQGASIATTILETTKANLQLAVPFLNLYSDSGSIAAGFGSNAGADLLEKCVQIKVHPLNTLSSDNTDDEDYIDDDWTFWKVASAEAVEIGYNADGERAFDVTFTVFPDFDKTAGQYLFVIGDPDVAAVAGGTVPSILSSLPADLATGVTVTDNIVLDISGQLKMADSTTPNGSFKLFADADHSEIAATVTAEDGITGDIASATTTTAVLESGAISADDSLNGAYIVITEGAGKSNTPVAITDSVLSTNTITVAAWPSGTPDSTSYYEVLITRVTINPAASLSATTKYDVVAAAMSGKNSQISTSEIISFTTAA